jgi:hypothetical protein
MQRAAPLASVVPRPPSLNRALLTCMFSPSNMVEPETPGLNRVGRGGNVMTSKNIANPLLEPS